VRSHFPWPLRWAMGAVMLGFSAALALWAFELGKEIAGLDRGAKEELVRLRSDVSQLQAKYREAKHVSDTADSLLKSEKAAQERLAQQLRQLESDKQSLQADLGFFQRLLPTGGEGLQLRGLQADQKMPGQIRYQILVLQDAKGEEFNGRYEVVLSGQLDAKNWSMLLPGGPRGLQVKQVARVEGTIDHPPAAVIKTLQVRIMDTQGATRATQTVRL